MTIGENDKPIRELYITCVHAFEEFKPLKGKGAVSKKFSKNVLVAVTADEPQDFVPEGCMGVKIEPFRFYVWRSGWLVAIVGPGNGTIIGVGQEDDLIRIIKEASS